MISKENLNRLLINLIIAIPIALLVFSFPITAYKLGQLIGPKVGESAFKATHPNPLGKMVYEK